MIESIDFLPADYHRKRQRSQKTYWRSAVFVAFVLLVGAGAIRQHLNRCQLEATRDRLKQQADRMVAQLQNPEGLKKRIQNLETRSELIETLRFRTAPTGILQVVTNTLPRYVRLTRIQMGRESIVKQNFGRGLRSRRGKTNAKKTKKSPEQIDLEQLRMIDHDARMFVSLEGVAPDDVAISQYLAALESSGIPHTVQLLFTDRHKEHDTSLRRFGVRLQIRQIGSAGQPNGPLKKSANESFSEISIGLYRPSTEMGRQRP